jgi:TPR repeat protein
MGSVPFFASGVYSPDIDAPLAITACQRAVAAWPNEARFHSQLGRALERSGRPAEALVAFRRAAAMGYAPAQTILAFAAERGDLGVKQDLTEAVRLYRLAADQGMALAQTNLAVLLRDGRGAPRDPVAAFSLLQSAATYPFGPAISNLAWLFEQGLGTAANPGEALRLYRIAAGPGLFDVFAQYRLGGMFERGELGMPQDRAQAVAMYRAAARQGEQNSITALRRMGEREPW